MVVLNVIHDTLTAVFSNFLRDAVSDIGFQQQGIPDVFFIGQNVMDDGRGPALHALGRGNAVLVQLSLDLA